ncbi:MAG: amidohydrolase family protein [Chloroflexota bacterium]|nr:amidohydrolase family protein [Chloroflexota bacterium]MDE2683867.1 amidohydrolase family protein [Chloroflexota bacterium]
MRAIDIHAHSTPQCFQREVLQGRTWHGMTAAEGELFNPRNAWTPEQRIADMDSIGVDVQVVSTNVAFYKYDQDVDTTVAIATDCNDEVHQMTLDYPERLSGLATLPMQDVRAAIAELERAMTTLGLKGAMINDHVNGRTYDDPAFLPFWRAAEQMGAVLLIHQANPTMVAPRIDRYHLPNTIGNLAERAVTFASFVFGGVMDQCPDLKVCLAHGGGYTCFGAGRMDRGWLVRREARVNITQPPSEYLDRFYYDCLTHSEPALRMLIDSVGIDRVVLGTDWPADMMIDWPVGWVMGLPSLTQDEKEAILWKNLEKLLGI